ncbi:hypothetical protein RvY_13809 [Ramazzottius varieornatus]|uniref:MICOS complex subunit n=1 Tax=Ramazzottius varieornatus TaxID=947166 RepID=A0A1D1VP61_RAMVA|nr:hypothetical protein RvY_13809 [Ramazzottius varieornatus]
MIRLGKAFTGAGAVSSAAVGLGWSERHSDASSHGQGTRVVKISDLPVYDEQPPPTRQAYFVEPTPPPILEEKIGEVRRSIGGWWQESAKSREKLRDKYEIGKAHSKTALEMLRDDTKVLPRAIVISAGGLLGLLLAIRKNFLKKVLYTSAGLGGAAVVCYPAASKDLALTAYANVTDLAKGFEKKKPTLPLGHSSTSASQPAAPLTRTAEKVATMNADDTTTATAR